MKSATYVFATLHGCIRLTGSSATSEFRFSLNLIHHEYILHLLAADRNKPTLTITQIRCCRPISLARRKKASAGRSCSRDPQGPVSGTLASAPALRQMRPVFRRRRQDCTVRRDSRDRAERPAGGVCELRRHPPFPPERSPVYRGQGR